MCAYYVYVSAFVYVYLLCGNLTTATVLLGQCEGVGVCMVTLSYTPRLPAELFFVNLVYQA